MRPALCSRPDLPYWTTLVSSASWIQADSVPYLRAAREHASSGKLVSASFARVRKGKKKLRYTASSGSRSRRRKDTAYSSWLALLPSPFLSSLPAVYVSVPFDVSVPLCLSISLSSSFFNKPCPPVPLRARISLSSWHNLISLGARGNTPAKCVCMCVPQTDLDGFAK